MEGFDIAHDHITSQIRPASDWNSETQQVEGSLEKQTHLKSAGRIELSTCSKCGVSDGWTVIVASFISGRHRLPPWSIQICQALKLSVLSWAQFLS